MEGNKLYPDINIDGYDPKFLNYQATEEVSEHAEECDHGEANDSVYLENKNEKDYESGIPEDSLNENNVANEFSASNEKPRKYFHYDPPHLEESGVWIPVSVPPMLENEHEEWNRGLSMSGGYFPDGDLGWNQLIGEDKEMTMWDVFLEMLLAAKGKVTSITSDNVQYYAMSWISKHLLEQAWNEMAHTLTEANFSHVTEILESEPPKWLADSAASACMLCNVRFHPIMCSRHHCRFCGGLFCNECSKGRSLMPEKFRNTNPQRVCDVCCVRLESVQPYLMELVSRAAQPPIQDLTDLSTLRSWLNFPWSPSMEYEIYKATNTIRGYKRVGSIAAEKPIPDAILKHAKGIAIITSAKVGIVMAYNVGTGLVVARREDGSWSPPSAISTFGIGWGAQAGGEMTDFIIVLKTTTAVKTFCGNMHLSVGAGLSAAAGLVGRAAEANLRAGDGGYAACYTYSCSKGAFVGCSLEGSIIMTRSRENARFYGNSSISVSDLLLGSFPRPPAATILYQALSDLFRHVES